MKQTCLKGRWRDVPPSNLAAIMIKLCIFFGLCFLLEGAIVARQKNIGNNRNRATKGDELPSTGNDSLPEQKARLLFPQDIRMEEEKGLGLREHPVNDKLGPPETRAVDRAKCHLREELVKEIEGYKKVVGKIMKFVFEDFRGRTFDTLAELTDTFGARMTGSKELEASIDWILMKSRDEGLQNTHTEPVEVPHWVRNNETLYLLYPRIHKLSLLGLGSSVGTPKEGIVAKVFVVKSFKELKTNAEKIKGKIVIFNPEWTTYREMVQYRVYGASKASKAGAVASLIRSVTPFSINSPHTGWQLYDRTVPRIPTACITTEDAEMFQRYQDRGENVLVHLYMGAQNLPNVVSRNTITELVGYELPDEVVVVSGHLDSWDVGVGAMDDGGGSIISWIAPVILRKLGLRSRRTVRTVLFTGEEQGLYGGKAYYKKHSPQKEKFQLLLESDSGTFDPRGLSFSGNDKAKCIISKVLSLMQPLGTTELATPMNGGPDISMWENAGVPIGSFLNSNENYFWFHHSAGDTMSVEDSDTLDRCAALWTAVAYIMGDLNITLPR